MIEGEQPRTQDEEQFKVGEPRDSQFDESSRIEDVQQVKFEQEQPQDATAQPHNRVGESGRIEDKDLAWDMALASKPERETAVEFRKIAKGNEHNFFSKEKYVDHTNLNRGKYQDERAENIEEWAKILHEHPLPESFIESEQITARGLVSIEDQVEDSKHRLKRYTEALEEANVLVGVNGVNLGSLAEDVSAAQPLYVIRAAYGMNLERESKFYLVDFELEEFDKEVKRMADVGRPYPEEGIRHLKEYCEAIENPKTTLGQLKDMYADAFKKAYIEPNREFIDKNQTLLDQIRSGSVNETFNNNNANI